MQFEGTQAVYVFSQKICQVSESLLKDLLRISKFSQQQIASPLMGLRAKGHLLALPFKICIGMACWSTPLRLSLPTQHQGRFKRKPCLTFPQTPHNSVVREIHQDFSRFWFNSILCLRRLEPTSPIVNSLTMGPYCIHKEGCCKPLFNSGVLGLMKYSLSHRKYKWENKHDSIASWLEHSPREET